MKCNRKIHMKHLSFSVRFRTQSRYYLNRHHDFGALGRSNSFQRIDSSTPLRPCYPGNDSWSSGNLPSNSSTSGHTWSQQHFDLRSFYGRISHPAPTVSVIYSLLVLSVPNGAPVRWPWTGYPWRNLEKVKLRVWEVLRERRTAEKIVKEKHLKKCVYLVPNIKQT